MMGEIYQLLYTGKELTAMNLKALIERLIGHLREGTVHSQSVKITANLEEVIVSPQIAFVLGIIVNELITNACKHAFSNTAGGTIHVQVARVDGARYRLSVSDDGAGSVPGQPEFGFGLNLISALIQQQGWTMRIGPGAERVADGGMTVVIEGALSAAG